LISAPTEAAWFGTLADREPGEVERPDNEVPHPPQNFSSPRFLVPHFGHATSRAVPH
jgi:hypothetical protein